MTHFGLRKFLSFCGWLYLVFVWGSRFPNAKAQPGYWVPFPGDFYLPFVLLFVAADHSELQAGRNDASRLLVPSCVPTHDILQNSTRVSWDPSTLLHREVALVVHKRNCTQSAKPKT